MLQTATEESSAHGVQIKIPLPSLSLKLSSQWQTFMMTASLHLMRKYGLIVDLQSKMLTTSHEDTPLFPAKTTVEDKLKTDNKKPIQQNSRHAPPDKQGRSEPHPHQGQKKLLHVKKLRLTEPKHWGQEQLNDDDIRPIL